MQKAHVLFAERLLYLRKRARLLCVERTGRRHGKRKRADAVRDKGICFQHALLPQRDERACRAVAVLAEIPFRHLAQQLQIAQRKRGGRFGKVKIAQQEPFLPLGTFCFQRIEQGIHCLLAAISLRQAHMRLRAGTVSALHALAHADCALFHKALHCPQHAHAAQRAPYVRHAHSLSVRQGSEQPRLLRRKLRRRCVKVRLAGYDSFALQLEPRGERGFHHLARRANVICRHPFPEIELRGESHRICVCHFRDFLHLHPFGRRLSADFRHHGRIVTPGTERHHHARPHAHPFRQRGRERVGKLPLHGKGHQHFCV